MLCAACTPSGLCCKYKFVLCPFNPIVSPKNLPISLDNFSCFQSKWHNHEGNEMDPHEILSLLYRKQLPQTLKQVKLSHITVKCFPLVVVNVDFKENNIIQRFSYFLITWYCTVCMTSKESSCMKLPWIQSVIISRHWLFSTCVEKTWTWSQN